MEQLILDYLKTFKIDLKEILDSGRTFGETLMNDPVNKMEDLHRLNYTLNSDGQEIDIEFYCENKADDAFNHFSDGLVKLIEENSKIKVQYTEFNNGAWFGWNDNETKINFGIKNEEFRFEARFSARKN